MNILITKTNTTIYPNLGRYFFAELSCGKHAAAFCFGPNEVRIIVQNASNRAWRGMGKGFPNVAAALANYKTAEIRAMIETAAKLSAE